MTEQERYLFDLQGFLVIPNTLRSETVSLLNQLMKAKISESCVPNMKTHRFVGLLDWGYAYRELIDNPKVYDYLEELLGTNFRLDHDYADIILRIKDPSVRLCMAEVLPLIQACITIFPMDECTMV